jgi:hypothetical protein
MVALAKNGNSIQKVTKAKRTGGMAQVVVCKRKKEQRLGSTY